MSEDGHMDVWKILHVCRSVSLNIHDYTTTVHYSALRDSEALRTKSKC